MNPSLLIIPDRYKAAKLYSQIPDSGDGDFDVTRSTTATRVNASGLIESVASGVPRIDYTGGSCGKLLVEPAATNLLLYSEEFDDASWIKTGITITANTTIAPNGTTTADTISKAAGVDGFIQQTVNVTTGSATSSVFILKDNDETRFPEVVLRSSDSDGENQRSVQINTKTGQSAVRLSTGTTSHSVEDYILYWRVIITVNTITNARIAIRPAAGTTLGVFNINASGSVIAWGAQLEVGSVATSYIPTVAATVTRNADVISLSSVSGLIGQTEGTLFAEVDLRDRVGDKNALSISVTGNQSFSIRITPATIQIIYRNGGAGTLLPNLIFANTATGIFKLAFAYKDADYAFAVNGVIATSTTASVFPVGAFGTIEIGSVGLSTFLNDRISAAAIYTTRLDNATLASLTTL